MARTRTLLQLRDQVRVRADIVNDPHLTDAEINEFINGSIADLQSEMVQQSEGDFVTDTTIVTAAGDEQYDLAPAFYKLVSVDFDDGSGEVRHMRRWNFAERAMYLSRNAWSTPGAPVAYRLVGEDQIRFLPVPTGVYTVTVWVVLAPVTLEIDGDTFDGRAGWEEWVVLDAAIKCKLTTEEDIRDLERLRTERMGRILAQMATKDQGEPDRVQDVRRRECW